MADTRKPVYTISVVADLLKIHPQTLRLYERKGLIKPGRTVGRTRMYSADDVEDIERILRLTRDLGVNLAGAEIIIKMRGRMLEMQTQLNDLLEYVKSHITEGQQDGRVREALVKVASGQLRKLEDF